MKRTLELLHELNESIRNEPTLGVLARFYMGQFLGQKKIGNSLDKVISLNKTLLYRYEKVLCINIKNLNLVFFDMLL